MEWHMEWHVEWHTKAIFRLSHESLGPHVNKYGGFYEYFACILCEPCA